MRYLHFGLTLLLMLVATSILLPAAPAGADDMNWTAAGGGAFGNTACWDNGVPSDTCTAIFNVGPSSAYHVSFTNSPTVWELQLRTGTIDLDLAGHSLGVQENLLVGYDGADWAWAKVNGGALTSAWADVGHAAGNTGRLTFSGAGSSWSNVNDVTVGRASEGTVEILEGATVTLGRDIYVGNTISGETASAVGNLAVSGAQSSLNLQRMLIGCQGPGAAASGTATISDHATVTGTGQFSVGSGGVGTLTINGGAVVSSAKATSATLSSGIIGSLSGQQAGNGHVVISGADSKWTQDGTLNVGYSASGTLIVEGGGAVESATGVIARTSTADGHATITGLNSNWTVMGSMYIGGSAMAVGGVGTLDVADHGQVTIWGSLHVYSGGTVNLASGAVLEVDPLFNSGVFTQSGGSTTVVSINSDGSMSVTGGTVLANYIRQGSLTVGASAGEHGSITIRPNGTASGLSVVGSMTIEGGATPSGKMNLSNNDLLISGGDASAVRSWIVAGYKGGTWTGNGLYTNLTMTSGGKATGLGYAKGDDPAIGGLAGSFDGEDFDDDAVLVKFTYIGDANLDGSVDGSDVALWAQNFSGASGANPANPRNWTQGDWNYDGSVDGSDVALWAQNFTGALGGGGLGANPAAGVVASPEPCSALLMGIAAATALSLRRRAPV